MNLHEIISTDIQRVINQLGAVDIISPTFIAMTLQAEYAPDGVEPKIAYGSIEHLKHMARKALSRSYDAESDETEAHQGELFSGQLQRRYPTPHKRGEEPTYRLLEAMTDVELEWNEKQLAKSALARQLHADALRAYRQSRRDAA